MTNTTTPAQGNQLAKQEDNPIKEFFAAPSVLQKFKDLLGTKAQGFVTSVLQIANGSEALRGCTPRTIFTAAATAATMDLPINPNLGFAHIVPYSGEATFQIGYKGLVQLAMRTGQYLRLNVIPVYENQFKSWNELTEELVADFSIQGTGNVVGYCSYFKLLNGFEKTVFWTTAKVKAHASRYSKSYQSGKKSIWKDDFESMALKTVLKNTLSKWGILSIEMQRAIVVDQAVIEDTDSESVRYPDGTGDDNQGTDWKGKADDSLNGAMDLMNKKKNNNG
jgi:recombination protein RecT